MERQATVSNSLTGRFRYSVLFLWVLACAVIGWVSLTDHRPFERIFWGAFSIIGLALLLFFINEESALVSNHVVTYGEVISYRPRRGRWNGGEEIRYSFTAVDGRVYEATSGGKGQPGERIPILYNPLGPAKNKPLASFMFYRFNLPEALS
jgi:hypothetical protein